MHICTYLIKDSFAKSVVYTMHGVAKLHTVAVHVNSDPSLTPYPS